MDEFDRMFGSEPDEFDQMFGSVEAPPAAGFRQPKQNKGTAGDLATSVKRGVLGLPGMVTGVADLPIAIATGARPVDKVTDAIGKFTGFRPSKWAEEAKAEYSPGYKAAQAEINQAWDDPNTSGLDVAKSYASNPGQIANIVAESLPSMVAGGVAGRAIATAGKAAGAAEGFLARKFGEKAATSIAAGGGEGVVTAGGALDQAQGEDQQKNALAALGAGAVTGLVGGASGAVAQKLGVDTLETAMVKGFQKSGTSAASVSEKAAKIAVGAGAEGSQEFTQSAQEQAWSNYADGNALGDGVLRAGVEGALAGVATGGAVNTLPAPKATPVKDQVQSTALSNLGVEGTVENGEVTIVTAAGDITKPVAEVAASIAKGEPVVSAQEVRDTLSLQASQEAPAPPAVEELPTRQTMPTTILMRVGEEVYGYIPPAGTDTAALAAMAPQEKLDWFKANRVSKFRARIVEDELKAAQGVQDVDTARTVREAQGTGPGASVQETGNIEGTARAEVDEVRLPVVDGDTAQNTEQITPTILQDSTAAPFADPLLEPGLTVPGSDTTTPDGQQFPDVESWKASLPPEQLTEVEEYEDLRYKSTALQGPEKGYKPYSLTAKQKARLAELDSKYARNYLSPAAAQLVGGVTSSKSKPGEDPDTDEATEVQAGVEGKTVLEVAQFLVDNAPDMAYKAVARFTQVGLKRIKALGVDLDFAVAHLGDQVPRGLIGGRGLTVTNFDNKKVSVKVWLNGADVTGKVGVSYETVLHELIHAATQAAIHLGNIRANAGTTTAKMAADLISVTNTIIGHFNNRVTASRAGKIQLTEFEQRVLNRGVNALDDQHEILAWALTSKDMQDYLETIPSGKTDTLWTKFVKAVRTFLGLPASADTTLSEVLRIGEELLLTSDPIQMLENINKATQAQTTARQVSSAQLSNPISLTSAEMPKFKTKEEVTAFKESLRSQGYDGIYLTDKQQSFALDPQATTGETADKVVADVKTFLGRGYDNLVRRGKLEVVQSMDDAKATGIPMRGASGKIAGVYNPKLKKIVLIADNIEAGDGQYVMSHEGAHALLREDPKFVRNRDRIISDFLALAETSESVRVAIARVPKNTNPNVKGEEALAHWLQDKKNHKHSLYRRIISAVKAALFRLGLPHGRFTEADLARIFTGGVQAWSIQSETAQTETSSQETLASAVDDIFAYGRKQRDAVSAALADPKSKFHNFFLQHADKWLGVLPPSHIAQTFGKKIQQLKDLDRHSNEMQSIKIKITDDAFDIQQTAVKTAEKGKGVDVMNNALLTGTFNQMLPWADQYSQEWGSGKTKEEILKSAQKEWKAAGMQKTTGKTYLEAHREASDAWDAMDDASKEQAMAVLEDLKKVRQRERDNLLAYIDMVTVDDPELRAQLMDRFDATLSNIKGIYAPLSRYGKFRLDYTRADGAKATEYFETIGERDDGKLVAISEGAAASSFVEGIRDESIRSEVAIPSGLIQQVMNKVRAQFLDKADQGDPASVADAEARAQEVVSDINQTFLRWLPDTAALKNSVHRKNVRGASTDMLRSYLDYMQRHASSIAWMEVGKKLEADIQSMAEENRELAKQGGVDLTMRGHLLNNSRKWLQAIRTEKVSPISSVLGKLSTGYYMTSPSTFLVQLTQLPALTLPNLSARFGAGKSAAALLKASQQAFSKDYSKDAMLGDANVNAVYEALHRRVSENERTEDRPVGSPWYTPAQKAALIAEKLTTPKQLRLLMLREAVAMNLLDISAVHEAQAIAFGKEATPLGKIMKYAMLPMQYGELGSRKAAALAAFELATASGKDFDSAMADVKKTIDETLYSYSKEDKGYLLQGSIPRVLMQFQTYRVRTALRLGLLMHQSLKGETPEVKAAAWKEFKGIAGMSALLGGANGLVFGSLIFSAASLFGGSDDEPYDSKLAFSNWAKEMFGETGGQVAEHGIFTLLGVNVSKRIGMGDIYGSQSEPPSNLHGAGLAAWYAGNLLGPSFSVAQSWVKGYDEIMNKGNYMKGLEAATPKPIRDALKTLRIAQDGLKDGQGTKLIADEDIDPQSLLMLFLGFQPDEIAAAQTANYTKNKLSTQLSERRGRLISDAAKAIMESENTDGPLEAIRKFNSSMPAFAISGRDIKPAVRKIITGETGITGRRDRLVAEEFGVPVYSE